MARIHDRMPVILPESAWDRWLDPRARRRGRATRRCWCPSSVDELEAYPVSTARQLGPQRQLRSDRPDRGRGPARVSGADHGARRPRRPTRRRPRQSFWLETCGDDLTPRPAARRFDRGRRRHPGRRLHRPLDRPLPAAPRAVAAGRHPRAGVRRLRCVGAQRQLGRAGAQHLDPGARPAPRHRRGAGDDRWRRIEAVDEVGRAAGEEGIAIDWHKGGRISVARGPNQLPALEETLADLRAVRFRRPPSAARCGAAGLAAAGRRGARRHLHAPTTRRSSRPSSSAGWRARSSVAARPSTRDRA